MSKSKKSHSIDRRHFIKASTLGTLGGILTMNTSSFSQDVSTKAIQDVSTEAIDMPLKEVTVLKVTRAHNTGHPIVILKDDEDRSLVIWVGNFEAETINAAITGQIPPEQRVDDSRPRTHDFIRNTLQTSGVSVLKAVIAELKENKYYAVLYLQGPDKVVAMDCRPSDAIALSLRTKAPIFVSESIMKSQAMYDFDIERAPDW